MKEYGVGLFDTFDRYYSRCSYSIAQQLRWAKVTYDIIVVEMMVTDVVTCQCVICASPLSDGICSFR